MVAAEVLIPNVKTFTYCLQCFELHLNINIYIYNHNCSMKEVVGSCLCCNLQLQCASCGRENVRFVTLNSTTS